MLGDLDMLQCAQKDAPTMRRLSVELGAGSDIPAGGHNAASLRRVSTSSMASSTGRSSMSTDSGASLSPTFSSSLPNSFYLERVSSLLGRASSLPLDRHATGAAGAPCGSPASVAPSLPTIPASGMRSPSAAGGDPTATRVTSLIRSLSKGMNNFN